MVGYVVRVFSCQNLRCIKQRKPKKREVINGKMKTEYDNSKKQTFLEMLSSGRSALGMKILTRNCFTYQP